MTAVADTIRAQRDTHLEQLKELLRIPSVSTDPARKNDVLRAAEWVRARLAAAGCTHTELIATDGHPMVYGEWLGAPGKPTILVYGHYDVQPEDPLDEWATPPFEPTVKDGRIYARGASDDKGQVIVHVNALEAHLKANGRAPINVKFLIEGEEEIGSHGLETFLPKGKERLACDAVVISDTAMFAPGLPSICYGLRGLAYLQVEMRGTDRDLHSGSYGGSVVNPANALADLLASLKDAKGRIKIDGFYDDVVALTRKERKAWSKLPHKDARFRKAIGAPALSGERGHTTLERVWGRPSLDVNGIWGGFTGEGAKTVIPAVARAKISMRLVPDQKPADIARKVKKHLKKIAPDTVKIDVRDLHGGTPWKADTGHPALQAAGRAMERAFGAAPVFVREGGSIPIVAAFAKTLKVPCVLMGIGLNDDNLHAPNEKLDLVNFERGNDAAAHLLDELGKMDVADFRTSGKAKPEKAKKKGKKRDKSGSGKGKKRK